MRHGLDRAALVELFAWSEAEFLEKTRGSAIRRIGFERWLRNIAVALGNAPTSPEVIAALALALEHDPRPWCASMCAGRSPGTRRPVAPPGLGRGQ